MPQGRSRQFWVGTSGYNYAEWKGSFYPEKFSSKKMLPYYAERLPTVEINYTFYRMPTERLLLGWSELVPEAFSTVQLTGFGVNWHAEGRTNYRASRPDGKSS